MEEMIYHKPGEDVDTIVSTLMSMTDEEVKK